MCNGDNNLFFLLNKKNEKITISKKNNTIMYEISNKFSIQPSTTLIENVKIFDVSLDSNDRIHLICTTTNGELCYFKYDNSSWSSQIMKRFSPLSNNIENISIISLKNTVHIFYAFSNMLNKKLKKIVHLFNIDNKWRYYFLDNVSIKEKPYLIDYDDIKGIIYFLSKTVEGKKIKFKIREFLFKKNTWKLHPKITLNSNIKDITFFLVDKNQNYHLLALDKNNPLNTYYIFKNPNSVTAPNYKLFKNEKDSEQLLLEVEGILYFISKSNNSITYCMTSDFGFTWSNPQKYNLESIFDIHIISDNYESKKLYKKISTFGYYYKENFYILGFNRPFYIVSEEKEDKLDSISDLTHQSNELYNASKSNNSIEDENSSENRTSVDYTTNYHLEEHNNTFQNSFIQKIIDFLRL